MDVFAYISSFKTVAPIEAANKEYLALEIQPGGKYLVNFNGGKKYYLAISEESIKPMFNNPYYGVVLVITDPNPTHRNIWVGRLYVRGNAVVLCDKIGERFITNCGEDSDYFYTNTSHDEEEREMPKEDYLDILRRHFKKLYLDYWVENPEQWQKRFNGALQKIRPLKFEGGKDTYSLGSRPLQKCGAIFCLSMVKNTTIFALPLLFVWKNRKYYALTLGARKCII